MVKSCDSLPASLSKGPKKLDSFHPPPPYTKGLKVSYERVRPQESKYGGCVDGRHQRCHGNDG